MISFFLRVLTELEQLFELMEDFDRQVRWLKALSNEYERFFRDLQTVSGDNVGALLNACAEDWVQNAFMRELRVENAGTFRELDLYLRQLAYSYMVVKIRQWQTVDVENSTLSVSDIHEASRRFEEIFASPPLYRSCLQAWEEIEPDEKTLSEIRQTEVELGFVAGTTRLAGLLKLNLVRNAMGDAVTEDEKRDYLCQARKIFEQVSERLPSSDTEETLKQRRRVIHLVEQIDASNATC